MSKIFFIILLVCGLLCSCTSTESKNGASTDDVHKDISAAEAHALVSDNKDNSNFIVLDVRTPQEYAEGHIAGAKNVDYKNDNFTEQLQKLDKGKTYVVHCRSGMRSRASADLMKEQGFTHVYHLHKGFLEWEEEGYEVKK